MSSFTKDLKGTFLGYNKFRLDEPFDYYTKDGKHTIVVPAGFVSDGASIPKTFWTIIGSPWSGKHGKAAVIHDFLYDRQPFTRKKSDGIFIEAMKVLKVNWVKRRLMWFAVRVGGWRPWNKHKEELNQELTHV